MSDELLANGTVEFRQAERDHANGRLRGGPPEGYDDFDHEYDDSGQEWDCTHCRGEGICDANANPLWDCDDNPHPCHACGGSGLRRDQRIF